MGRMRGKLMDVVRSARLSARIPVARVLLVKPRFMGPEFRSITHPMGLMYVASTLRLAGHEPRILDCASNPDDFDAPARIASEWQPDCIGLSIIVSELEQASGIIKSLRIRTPEIPIVLGGPWPSSNPADALTMLQADYVVSGEGELTFPKLVDAIVQRRDPGMIASSIAGVAARVGDHVEGPSPAPVPDLDELPLPAWDLLDHDLYARTLSMAGVGCRPYMTVVTSRGCPFKCAYCHQTQGKQFRRRQAKAVIDELVVLNREHGFLEFEIVDDCFNLDRERMHDILKGIIEAIPGARLHFPNGVRADHLDPDDIKLLRRAGTVSACFAIETASPDLQKIIRKNLDIDKALAAIRAAVSAGIYSTGFFMLGLPGETRAQAQRTVEFAVSSPLHRAIFMLTTPFAGTELADMAARITGTPAGPNAVRGLNYFTSSINISSMTDQELNDVFRTAYRRFYLNPGRVFRVIFQHPRKQSLPRYAVIMIQKIIPGRKRTS